jgi:Recombinase
VARRRARRKQAKAQRHAAPPTTPAAFPDLAAVRPALVQAEVRRLAYTPTQAAQALGMGRSRLYRLLPYLDTIELPWGGTLIPVDELERLLDQRRRRARPQPLPGAAGRPARLPAAVVDRIRAERAEGKSLHQIAQGLNADSTPTAHGGRQWWPSTVRAVNLRSSAARAERSERCEDLTLSPPRSVGSALVGCLQPRL